MKKVITQRTAISWCALLVVVSTAGHAVDNSKDLYDKIIAQDEAQKACLAIKIKCDPQSKDACNTIACNTGNILFGGNTAERDALAAQLLKNFKAGDMSAAFHWGYLNWIEGEGISDTRTDIMRKYQLEKFKEAYSGFSVASKGGIAAASWNIAVM